MRPRTLRGRLTLLYAALVCGALLTVGAGAVASVWWDLREDAAERAAEGLPPEGLDPGQRALLVTLAIGLPLVAAAGGAGGWLIARRALKPLADIAAVTRAVSADHLDRRVPTGGGAEVEEVAASLNALLERLARALADARRFTADAAHELRTPLAAVMGRLEVALRHPRGEADLADTIGGALEELQRLRALIDGLLTLARSDAGQLRAAAAPVDLAAVAARLVERDRPAADERAITVSLASDGPARALGDPGLLERAIGNLVANAVAYGRAGGRIDLRVGRRGDRAVVAVEDDGPGVPEAERARLFQRFFRGDAARARAPVGGFGLGLSIAREIVAAHGGTLAYAPRDGGGSVFTVELPAA